MIGAPRPEPIDGFAQFSFDHGGRAYPVYHRGDEDAPAVVLMHELPGMVPECIDLARRLVDAGHQVFMPLFFGTPGSFGRVSYLARVCISREFTLFAKGETSPITNWLRGLCAHAHEQAGGPGVGVIGMCLTGGFGLALMAEPAVIAPVLSQPSLPLGPGRSRARDVGVDPDTLAQVKERVESEDREILGLRFTGDVMCRKPRFDELTRIFGDRFLRVEIDSRPGNPHGIGRFAHSVLTVHYDPTPGSPTHQAYDTVLNFFARHLGS